MIFKSKTIILVVTLVLAVVVLLKIVNALEVAHRWPKEFYRYNVINIPKNEKDYIVVSKDPLEDVDPEVLSPPLTNNAILYFSGAKGQYVPFSFVILAIKDVKKVKILISDLKDNNNNLIASEHIEVRVGMRQAQRKLWKGSPKDFIVSTRFLPEYEPFDLPKGTFREVYFLIRIPSQARHGTYKGGILIKPDSNKSTNISISLEVFPFTLQKPPNKKYGMYYQINDSLRLYNGMKYKDYANQGGKRRAKLEIEQMKKYEAADVFVLDSGIWYQKISNEIKISYKEIETVLSILRESGIKNAQVVIRTRFETLGTLLGHNIMEWKPGKTLDGTGYENLSKDKTFYSIAKKALEGLKEVQKRYPEFELILSHYSDEIDYPEGRLPLYIELTKAARQVPEFKIYVTYHLTYRPWRIERLEKLRKEVDPYVDIRGHHGGFFEWYLIGGVNPQEYKEELDKSGDLAWVYYNPLSPYQDAYYYRVVNGLKMWSNDTFSAHVPWTYFYHRRGHTDVYNDLLQNEEGMGIIGFSFPSWKDGITPVPTKIFEGWREGIYDIQYFYTLEQQIKKCKSKSVTSDVIKEAENWLLETKSLYPTAKELTADEKKWDGEESLNCAPITEAAMKRIAIKKLNYIRYKTAQYIISLIKRCKE